MVRYDGPEGNTLYVGADNTMDFDYSNAMALYMDAYSGATKWNYTSAVPKVRLNITPPWLGEEQIEADDQSISVQAYPNPCTDKLTIRYALEKAGRLSYKVTNVNGQVLIAQELGRKAPGTYTEEIKVNKLPIGVYFYRLRLGGTYVSGRFVKM
jgi:hypothetical protein